MIPIYNFSNDYSEGCHPSILEALGKSNLVQESGYGEDSHTKAASNLIRNKCNSPHAAIHLIAGGTLTNLIILASLLRPFESIIAPSTGHISTNEAGAIEATGHKIETVASADGKLYPDKIEHLLYDKVPLYHKVKPRVVYISNSTELGTIYTKKELTDLSVFCRSNDLILFMDGARLPAALTAPSNDLTLEDIARLVDIFYIGGTKCGALLGEAIVIPNESLQKDFKYHIKQRGAMMAKGRVMGIQFEQLLRDDLILDLARRANMLAMKITQGVKKSYPLLTENDTNQVFPILPNPIINSLKQEFEFLVWKKIDAEHSAIRLITSWATPESEVDKFIEALNKLS